MYIHSCPTSTFSLQSYADEGHELGGVLEHVYRSMEDYFRDCLSLDVEETGTQNNWEWDKNDNEYYDDYSWIGIFCVYKSQLLQDVSMDNGQDKR